MGACKSPAGIATPGRTVFAFVFSARPATLPRQMSLNRTEQLVSDYVEQHPEEKSYWVEKVRAAARAEGDERGAAARLADDLWTYVVERSAVAQPFRDRARHEGLSRTSMRNLAEHWLRLWVPPRPKPAKPPKDFLGKF
jgi:hypothetical protein